MSAIVQANLGQCYRVAASYVIDNGGTLVHGLIRNDVGDVGHAWVELPERDIYEPTTDTVMPMSVFRHLYHPYGLARYKRDEILAMTLTHKQWGPWDDQSNDWHTYYHVAASDHGSPITDEAHREASKYATALILKEEPT